MLASNSGDESALPEIPPSPRGRDAELEKPSRRETIIKEARETVTSLLAGIEKDKHLAITEQGMTFSQNALKAFAASTSITVEKFINSGGLKSLAMAVRKYISSSNVVESGCRALSAFTLCTSSAVTELVRVGAIEVVIQSIRIQSEAGNLDATICAMKALRNLTQTEESREEIASASGIEVVIGTMQKHANEARLASHCCLVLSNLSFGNTENKEKVGEVGGIAAIAKAMRDHQDYQPMQARGSLALRNLCYHSERNQKIAGESMTIEALLAAIKSYSNNREVAHQSCVALANLSNHDETNRDRIVDHGGTQIVLNLMNNFPKSATVNDDCISILRNISVGNKTAQTQIAMLKGVESIIGAIKRFPDDERMAEKGCASLRYLCFLLENRQSMGRCQGIETLVQVINKHENSVAVVENAILALGNASFECTENKETAGRCGGIKKLISAIERHRHSPAIQEHGCRVLRNLSDGFELNRLLEVEHGAIKTAIFAMMGYSENASVQEQACAMLLNLAMSPSNLNKLRDADVEHLVENALRIHAKHRGVQLQGGRLLDRINGFETDSSLERHGSSSGAPNNPDESERKPRRLLSKLIGRK